MLELENKNIQRYIKDVKAAAAREREGELRKTKAFAPRIGNGSRGTRSRKGRETRLMFRIAIEKARGIRQEGEGGGRRAWVL